MINEDLNKDIDEFIKKLKESKDIKEFIGTLETFKFFVLTNYGPKPESGNWLMRLGDGLRGKK